MSFLDQVSEEELFHVFKYHMVEELDSFTEEIWDELLFNYGLPGRLCHRIFGDGLMFLEELEHLNIIWIRSGNSNKLFKESNILGLQLAVSYCSEQIQDEFEDVCNTFQKGFDFRQWQKLTSEGMEKHGHLQDFKQAQYRPSFNCFELVKKWQNCRLKSYYDVGKVWLLGWGFKTYFDGSPVNEGDTITQVEADYYLQHEINKAGDEMYNLIFPIHLTQNQFDALTSFVYNIGVTNFQDSTLLKKLLVNPQDETIRNEFMRWIYAKRVVYKGLIWRREQESNLYFS